MVVQQSLKPTDLQLPDCFVYQSLSKELESNVQKQNIVFLSARWHHHWFVVLSRERHEASNITLTPSQLPNAAANQLDIF